MNTTTASSSLSNLQARWQTVSARERQLVALAAVAVGALLLWWLLLQPVWQTWRELPPKVAAVEADLMQMRSLAAEAKEFKGQAAVPVSQATEALKAAAARLGPHAKLSQQGDRATLTLTDASAAELRNVLAEARAGARARPVSAQLQHGPSGLQGQVIFSLPANP